MNLRVCMAEKNECFHVYRKHVPKGLMLHSTGANNPNLKRYVQPDDGLLGKNIYNNSFNVFHPGGKDIGPHTFEPLNGKNQCKVCGGRQTCVHGFIGKLKDGSIASYQTLPWDCAGWHSGAGVKGNANFMGYIGIEICEDNLENKIYFDAVYKEAVELFAYLCNMFDLDPFTDITDHAEGHKNGIASNHGDVGHWFPKHGKSIQTFRDDVYDELKRIRNKDDEWENTASDWAKHHWAKAKHMGILDGTNPKEPLTREQLSAVLDRLHLLD